VLMREPTLPGSGVRTVRLRRARVLSQTAMATLGGAWRIGVALQSSREAARTWRAAACAHTAVRVNSHNYL
jgi:hypothetical protein